MRSPPAIAVAGAGLIGRRHAAAIAAADGARLHAIVDPDPLTRGVAADHGVAWFPDLSAMIATDRPDGIVIATPNGLHVENGLQCVASGIPVLVEKPLATDTNAAASLVCAAAEAGVPLAVGHHRRHNPLVARAKALLAEGAIGRIVSVHAMFWLFKPDSYFDIPWRRQAGAGPVFVNLIHDIDLLRHFVGEITCVQARQSNAVRSHAVAETAVILFEFESGALGTANVSDTIVAPWSWELTAGENPAYSKTDQTCYLIGGTEGSLEIPNLKVWRNPGERSWLEPVLPSTLAAPAADPLVLQIEDFAATIRGERKPLVPGEEGLKTLAVIEAIDRSACCGKPIWIDGHQHAGPGPETPSSARLEAMPMQLGEDR